MGIPDARHPALFLILRMYSLVASISAAALREATTPNAFCTPWHIPIVGYGRLPNAR